MIVTAPDSPCSYLTPACGCSSKDIEYHTPAHITFVCKSVAFQRVYTHNETTRQRGALMIQHDVGSAC